MVVNVDWNAGVGALISALDRPQFASELMAALRVLVPFDYSIMFAYCGDAQPIDLYDDFPANKRRVFVTVYQEGPYLLDPFFLACARQTKNGLYRLRDLAPDRFYQGDYFRSYYVQTGLSEEIGYFINLPGSVVVTVSLMRVGQSPVFNAREFKVLRAAEPVVRAAVERHWGELNRRFSDTEPGGNSQSNIQRYIEHAFQTFGKAVLTPRERDVVEYVLKGYSSKSIGKVLDVSPGTVRIHRKNIYSKLGINSQGQLFSQFISALASDS